MQIRGVVRTELVHLYDVYVFRYKQGATDAV